MNILEQLSQLLGGGQPAASNLLTQAMQGGGQSQAVPAPFTTSMRDALAKLRPDQIAGPIPNSPPASAFAGDPKAFLMPTGGASGSWGAPPQPAFGGMFDFVGQALRGFGTPQAATPQADAPEVLPGIEVQTGVPIPPSRPANMGNEVRTQPAHANAQANKPAGNAFDKLLSVPIPPVRPAAMGGVQASLPGAMPVALTREADRPNGAVVMAGFGSDAPAANQRPDWNPTTDMPPELRGKAVNAGNPIGGRSSATTGSTTAGSGFNAEPLRRWANSVFTGLAMGGNLGDGLQKGAALAYQDQATQRTEGDDNMTRQVGLKLGADPDLLKSMKGQQLGNFVIQLQQAKLKAATPDYEYREVNGQLGRFNKNDPNAAFQPVAGAPTKQGARPITQDDRARWGIPDDDKRPYAIDENGKPMLIGGAGTTVNIGDSENGKLPSGYRWKDEANKSAGVVPIPGGPATQIPAETAARFGLAENYLGDLDDKDGKPGLRSRLQRGDATGVWDFARARNDSSSDAADVYRKMQSGADALQRFLTGAGMSIPEAEAYAKRYLPTVTDTGASAAKKADELAEALRSAKAAVLRGRGDEQNTPLVPGVSSPAPGAGWTDVAPGVRIRQR
jgi:hypothetical protein